MKRNRTVLWLLVVLVITALLVGSGEAKATPTTITDTLKSTKSNSGDTRYDGTYTGTFKYEYRENRLDKDGKIVSGEWIPASLALTVTLRTISTTPTLTVAGYMFPAAAGVEVTSVSCSEPNFGTGPSAITPLKNSVGMFPTDTPATFMEYTSTNPPYLDMGLGIFFPNGAFLGANLMTGSFSVSSEGRTLSGSAWIAGSLPAGSGPFGTAVVEAGIEDAYRRARRYDVIFKSWSLTKVSSPGLAGGTEPPTTTTQSPYDDTLAQLQSLRQQLDALLATYQSADANTRAMMDSAVASSFRQSLQQTYGALSVSDRAKVDDDLRRVTGYSLTQLLQMSSTVPGIVRTSNLLIDSIQGLASGTKPLGTTKPPPPAPPSIISVERPSQGGVVDLRGKPPDLKLRHPYGRIDLSEEQAQAIYDRKVKERIAVVDAAIAAATERLEKDKRQLEMYEKIIKEKDQQKIISALKNDLDEAKKESDEAMKELGKLLAKDIAGRGRPNIEYSIQLWNYGAGLNDILTLVGKTERTRKDWENAAKGLVTVFTTGADIFGFKVFGKVQSIFEISAGSIYLYLSDKRVDALENSIAQASISQDENRRRLERQILMDTIKLEQLNRDKNRLTKGYLN